MQLTTDGFDISEWQSDIQWDQIQPRKFLAVRAFDGGHHDPTFIPNWQRAATMGWRWLFVYGLLSDNDPQGQIDAIVGLVADSGVPWVPGMGIALDIENTKGHPTATRPTTEQIGNALCQRFGRPAPLTYSYYSGYVHVMAAENHWPLWLGWPVATNGDLPGDVAPAVHQWGTARPGEQPGFPNNDVDVNRTIGEDFLDAITGRLAVPTPEGFTMADLDTIHQMINTATDNLAGVVEQVSTVLQQHAAATDAAIAKISDLVTKMEGQSQAVAGTLDPMTFLRGLLKVLQAGVDHSG